MSGKLDLPILGQRKLYQGMVAVTLGINSSSLSAQRLLRKTTDELGTVYERLSSGQRINRASDDAAGAAIASKLSLSSKVYAQAVRNVNDGLSLAAVTEGALHSLSDITGRQQELAEQAANGSLSHSQRQALNQEAQALTAEFNRIVQTTGFNGVPVFDANAIGNGIGIQLGFGSQNVLTANTLAGIGHALGSGQYVSTSTIAPNGNPWGMAAGDLNGDGRDDLVVADYATWTTRIFFGNADGTFKTGPEIDSGLAKEQAAYLTDFNNDGKLDIWIQNGGSSYAILMNNGDESFTTSDIFAGPGISPVFADLNGDGKVDVAGTSGGAVFVQFGNGDGTLRASVTLVAGSSLVMPADFNGDGNVDLLTSAGGKAVIEFGSGTGSYSVPVTLGAFSTFQVIDVNKDGFADLIGSAGVQLGNGDGTFRTTLSSFGGALLYNSADLNGDGKLDLFGADTLWFGNGDGTFSARISYSGNGINQITAGDFNGDGVMEITAYDGAGVIIMSAAATTTAQAKTISLATRDYALEAIGTLSAQATRVSAGLGALGSFESRAAVAANQITSLRENYIAAGDRITSADTAQEAASLVLLQILQQASSAVLAQADQSPGLALTLLRS